MKKLFCFVLILSLVIPSAVFARASRHGVDFNDSAITPLNNKFAVTPEGGFAILLENNTGASSVKGETVKVYHNSANGVEACGANDSDCVGVFYSSGVANGDDAWVVVGGIADVKYDADGNSIAYGAFVGVGSTASRATASATAFSAGRNLGLALESATANSLGKVALRFN